MNSTELAAIIYTAKNATQEVWGPIKREQAPEEYPPRGFQQEDEEDWKKKSATPKMVVDNLAWQTYTIVLTNLLQMSVKEMQVEEIMDRINKESDGENDE